VSVHPSPSPKGHPAVAPTARHDVSSGTPRRVRLPGDDDVVQSNFINSFSTEDYKGETVAGETTCGANNAELTLGSRERVVSGETTIKVAPSAHTRWRWSGRNAIPFRLRDHRPFREHIEVRAIFGSTRNGPCKFSTIMTGHTARSGVPALSRLDRLYEARRRALYDNKHRVGAPGLSFHDGAFQMLRKSIRDRELVDAGYLFSQGMSSGPGGRWIKRASVEQR
jgi:hypothetical protein